MKIEKLQEEMRSMAGQVERVLQNTKYKIQNTTWLIADRADKVEDGPCREGGRCQGCPSSEKVQHSCNLPFPQILPFTFLPFCSGLALR